MVGERLNTFMGDKGGGFNSEICLKWNYEGRRPFKHVSYNSLKQGVSKGKNCL